MPKAPYIAPLGGMSLTISNVANTFAYCPAWQAWCGVDSIEDEEDRIAAARRKIYIYHLPEPANSGAYTREELEGMRPCVGLSYIPPSFATRSSDSYYRDRSATESFTEQATVFANIIDDVASNSVKDSSYLVTKFTNNLGLLIDELLVRENDPDCVFIQRVGVISEPNRVGSVQVAMKGDFIQTMLKLEIGVQ